MNVGKIFEQKFKESIPKYVAVIRLHDSASGFGQDSRSTRFSMKSPFDFILFKTPCMYCLELKSTDKKSFSFEREKPTKENPIKREIHWHQIQALTEYNKYCNCICGFVLDFRNDGTYFLSIKDFNKFKEESTKVSINIQDCIAYGAVQIDRKLKKKYYNYDVAKLLDKIGSDEIGKKNCI